MLRGRDQRQEREDHEHVHPPVHAPGQRCLRRADSVSRNVIISVAMNSAMTIDSIDTCVPSATGRTKARRIEQVDDAGEHRRPQTASAPSRYASNQPRVRQIDDAEAVQELDRACSRRRRRSPRTRARARGRRTAARAIVCRCSRTSTTKRRMRKPSWSSEKVLGAAAISRTRVATCAANAPTKASEQDQRTSVAMTINAETAEHAERRSLERALRPRRFDRLRFSAAISAGTISNRSPTMP